MLIASSFSDLLEAQHNIEAFKENEPTLYKKFLNLIQLTHQLQFPYQYMGRMVMDEDCKGVVPSHPNEYVLEVYKREVEKLKKENTAEELRKFMSSCKKIGYTNLAELLSGKNPKVLVGPRVVR